MPPTYNGLPVTQRGRVCDHSSSEATTTPVYGTEAALLRADADPFGLGLLIRWRSFLPRPVAVAHYLDRLGLALDETLDDGSPALVVLLPEERRRGGC